MRREGGKVSRCTPCPAVIVLLAPVRGVERGAEKM